MAWRRVGDCPPERCQGRCCQHIGLWIADPAFVETLRARGVKVIEVNGHTLADIPQRCQYLTNKGLCSLHPDMNPGPELPRRPDFCSRWPEEPAQLIADPYCGYQFIEE